MAEISENAKIADLERRLVSTYAETSAEQISQAVESARKRFDHSTIRDFVPLLVERRVVAQLTQPTPA